MLEKDIENLIANYPDEFFPKSRFTLLGQQIKIGRCYTDIIFKDKHQRKVIVEVKRGILSRDASGQVMEYYGLLKMQNPDEFVELNLCANIIPPERKKFLENAGIECKELGINLINQIAQKVGYQFINSQEYEFPKITNVQIDLPLSENIWLFQANPNRYNIMVALDDEEIGNTMHWSVNQYKKDISKGDIGVIWLSGKEAGIYAIVDTVSDPAIMSEPEAEKKYWIDDADKVERLRVKIKIIRNMLQNPLTKETIKQLDELKYMSVFQQPQGTNFRVKSQEWIKIKKLVEEL